MPYALLLFVLMPIVEIALLLRVGDAIGWLPTLAIVVLTAVLGTTMLRQQGLATLNIARQRLDAGEMPAQQMLEGVLLMVGGVLLLTPGFVTDAFGFACLLPASRQWIARRIASRSIISMSSITGFGVSGRGTGRGPTERGPTDAPFAGGGTTVGSGSTDAARKSPTRDTADIAAGGRPQPPSSAASPPSGEVFDSDFKRLDD
ncbi:MAG: FxsA family protein [Granulosicoccus sp.]|nr:FxsA family protein [Granulosicoccus sp.]